MNTSCVNLLHRAYLLLTKQKITLLKKMGQSKDAPQKIIFLV